MRAVGLIVGMWVSGLIIANAMPRLFVVAGGSLGVIGAVACACFGGGGACMACLCMNDKIREAEQNAPTTSRRRRSRDDARVSSARVFPRAALQVPLPLSSGLDY